MNTSISNTMKKHLTPVLILALVISSILGISLGTTGCAGQGGVKPTAQAVTYETLRQTSNFVDAYMKLYLAEVKAGKISSERQVKIDAAYTRVNAAIIAAAKVTRDGLDAQTPEEVTQTVANLTELLVAIIPPPKR